MQNNDIPNSDSSSDVPLFVINAFSFNFGVVNMKKALFAALGVTVAASAIACLSNPAMSKDGGTLIAQNNVVKTPSGLQYEDQVVGKGAAPRQGQKVVVHYTGWLTNGTKFDSSRDRNDPFSFTLGAGQVIKGWDEGVASMKVGGKRKLTVPPHLGYGERGFGNVIPPNSTLVFDVELLGVQ